MKSLQQHLTESLINEAYKPQYKPQDWEKVLNQFKPPYSNYSQLGGLENAVDYEYNFEDDMEGWIDEMISGGVKDTPENREILKDIFMWAMDNYVCNSRGWRDDAEGIVDMVNNLDPGEWAVAEEDYAKFMCVKKKLSGTNKQYGEVLANAGDTGEVAERASQYDGDNW